MHRAGIVGEEQAASCGQIDELAQGGFAGEVTRDRRNRFRNLLRIARRSAAAPNTSTEAPRSRATRAAAAANRSGSQRLAFPYAAPGLMPITGGVIPSAANFDAPASRAGRDAIQLDRLGHREISPACRRVAAVPNSRSAHDAGYRRVRALESRA